MPSNHLILCCPLLVLPSIFPSISVFSKESVLHIWYPEYWSFSFSISLSNEYSGLISFRMDWLNLLAVQGTIKSLPQHCSSKVSIVQCSTFLGSLTLLLSTRVPFPNKISCFDSTCVSMDNSFPSVRQEPNFGPWKGFPFLQQMVTLVGLFSAETDILTTRGTQGPACLPSDQTQLGPFCPWSPLDADNWPECPDR